jgi:hypothetical protein
LGTDDALSGEKAASGDAWFDVGMSFCSEMDLPVSYITVFRTIKCSWICGIVFRHSIDFLDSFVTASYLICQHFSFFHDIMLLH